MEKRLRGFLCAFALIVGLTPMGQADALVISEFLAINDTTIIDDDGDFSDWLEIHNNDGVAVDLDGWYLTDDAGLLTRWRIPAVTIAPDGYLLVWASGKNRSDPAFALHANFKISGSGEYLALVRPDGTTVEHDYFPAFPAQATDTSYGLASDLLTERCFFDPTPQTVNDESRPCGVVEEVVFSVGRGFYDQPFSVALTSPTPGATIHYTLDGSDPDPTNGAVYVSPLTVSGTTMLRAMAFEAGLTPSASVTHTYLFLDDVIQQSASALPPGFPTNWGGSSADYDMDPDVVNDPLYAATIKDDLKSIPTLSLVTDADNLFGAQRGIYVHLMGRGVEWERPVSAEFIFADGRKGSQINCGVRIQGASTGRVPFRKKYNLRLLFKSEYGPSKLVFPLFPDSPVDSFDTVTLTAGHGNSWVGKTGPARAQYLRDTWAKDTQLDMGRLASHSTYVHLYLNGLYWGLYRPTERPTAPFLAAHLGGSKGDWDALNAGRVRDGDRAAWDTLQDLANSGLQSQQSYEALLQYLDVENLIDYMIVNQYGGNWDWDHHNWYAGRKREAGAGYMFFSWDAEHVIENLNANKMSANNHDAPSSLYNNLRRENEEFRVLFGDRVHRHLFNDGALTRQRAQERFLKRSKEIDRAIVGESARWGDKGPTVPYTRDIEWLAERRWILTTFFPTRGLILLDQYRGKDLYPNVDAPSFNRHGGDVASGFVLTMGAPEGSIYYTDNGSDPRLAGGGISPTAQTFASPLTLTQNVTIGARALVDGEWSALNEARFIIETPVRITEIMYNPPGASPLEFIEIQNIGASPLDLVGLSFTEGIAFTFPSFTLNPGEHLVVVENQAAFESVYGTTATIAGTYTGRLSNGGERLRLADASGDAILDFSYRDSWYLATDGGGYSLVIRDPFADKRDWNDPAGWRASTFVNGSAGAPEVPLCGDGVDNDGDGFFDFPDDPGCADGSQDREDPECNDGIDNDGDGAIDLADPQCTAATLDQERSRLGDAFLSYQARRHRDAEPFQRVGVTLSDEFEAAVTFTVRKPVAIALSGDLDDIGVIDDGTHLQSYSIREESGQPRHQRRTGLRVENAFGTVFLDSVKASRLMVPINVDLTGTVSPPNDAAHQVDRYKCYRTRMTRNQPRYFPTNAHAHFSDQFEDRFYRLKKPRHFCTPADVDGQGIKNPEGYLVCYPTKYAKVSGKHIGRVGVHTADRFGPGLFDTRKEEELCVPSRLVEHP